MDLALLAIKLIVLLPLCSIGPGLLIVSRLRWSPIEKLAGAFAGSFIAIYLASFLLFNLNAGTWAYWTTSAIFAVMFVRAWPTAKLLLRHRTCRTALLVLALILAWDLLHLAMVRRYGGGGWAVDWREHYERTQYFLHQFPADYLFVGMYALPARPPLLNLLAAFFCKQVGLSFESYSLTLMFFNAWAVLPCCLLVHLLAPRRWKLMFVLAALFMLNPSIMENATLTVTKAMTAGLVVLGVCFYLRRRMVAAALTLAAGMLTHYSAVPFAAAVGLHYLWTILRGRRPLRQACLATVAGAALLGTWFVWSVCVFGSRVTFFSNTTAAGVAAASPKSNIQRILYNLFATIVPHPFHHIADNQFNSLGSWSEVGDYYFTMTQQTLPMMAGLIGGVVALGLAVRLLWSGPSAPMAINRRSPGVARGFWAFYIPFTFVLGVAVNPDWNGFGVGHVTLQSLAMMALALLAARWTALSPITRRLVVLGAAVDYGLGVYLLFDRESRVYATQRIQGGQVLITPDETLGRHGIGEYIAKLISGYVFWADHWIALIPCLQIVSLAGAVCAVWFLLGAGKEKSNCNRGI